MGYLQAGDRVDSQETSIEVTRTRSFSLGDADDGDYFDVQVCLGKFSSAPHFNSQS
jgi:hypothetical protein